MNYILFGTVVAMAALGYIIYRRHKRVLDKHYPDPPTATVYLPDGVQNIRQPGDDPVMDVDGQGRPVPAHPFLARMLNETMNSGGMVIGNVNDDDHLEISYGDGKDPQVFADPNRGVLKGRLSEPDN